MTGNHGISRFTGNSKPFIKQIHSLEAYGD
jgi:hypothetical protein